jgi:hypothetical protein
MTRTPRRAAPAATLAIALAALLALGPAAQAQRQRPDRQEQVVIPGGGTELLRALLAREGIQPVSARELRQFVRWDDDIIVVVLGDPLQPERAILPPLSCVRMALQSHGAVLIASDGLVQLTDPAGGWRLGEIKGQPVQADWRDCHRNDSDCPYATPVSPDEALKRNEKPGRVWDVFRGLNTVATNQPTRVEMDRFQGPCRYPLARLPKSAFSPVEPPFKQQAIFAVGGDGPDQWLNGPPGYSFLAVADSSVFINAMLMEPGTDNLELTLRTVEYLQGPDKHRRRCIFFENGEVIEDFDTLRQAMSKQKAKVPPENVPNMGGLLGRNQDKLVDLVDRMADQMQTKDGLHNWRIGREGSPEERRRFAQWVEGLSVLLAVVAVLLLLRRLGRARHPANLPPPPTTGAGAAATGPPGVFERREKELVRRNNLYEPVRNLLREFFESAGGTPGPRMPPVSVERRAVRKPESLRQALRDMWRLAYGPPVYVSAQRWFELEPYFERLRLAHADGKWRFGTGE